MNIILLSGGSGTRLWPLSNEVRSKQFIKIFRDENGNHESMVQRMYRMIREVDPQASITIATSITQVPSIKNQLGDDIDISVEPCRKDTFPAIALSVAYLHDIKGISANDSVVVCPVDPLVEKGYFELIRKMYDVAGSSNLCLMGIKPTYESEKYGYIIQKDENVKFVEKPSAETALNYIKQGALWNGGVFAFKLKYLIDKTKQLCGTSNYHELLKKYESLNAISFDYAVVEHESNIKVLQYSGEWKDLGTWNTFTEAMQDEIGGNVILGEKCENVHVVNDLSIPIIALGLKDIVIAASPDGILVSDKRSSSYLKKYVPNSRPMFEKREWGEYRVLDYQSFNDGSKSLTKELIVLPNKNVSYQRHFLRSEVWTITKGSGVFILDGKVKNIQRGDTLFVNFGSLHSVKAIDELHIIQVQMGNELLEEDIERLNYDWDSIQCK